MSNFIKKQDLRVVKTNRALTSAFLILLNKQCFNKITINDICEEALISRATFYAHFNSKYDLLRCWLRNIGQDIPDDISIYNESDVIDGINLFVLKNKKLIKNIVEDPDELTLDLLQEFIESVINKTYINVQDRPINKILLRFCAGGMISLLKWQVRNKFPSDIDLIDTELYNLLKYIMMPYTE